MPAFCRHNRFLHNCPICGPEEAAKRPRPAPRASTSASATRSTGAAAPRKASGSRRSTAVRTRKLARAAEDGYHSDLVPGVKATADAERLAQAIAAAAARLTPPGPYEAVATEPDVEEATWLAFLLALAGPDRPERQAAVLAARPAWGEGAGAVDPAWERTAEAYRAWAGRAGSQAAAFTGEASWSPERRFSRVYDRLSLPGLGRTPRFDLLATLGAVELYPLAAASLHLGGEDATTQAAKRALVSGDVLLLERRAAALAEAGGVPLAALDRGLIAWNAPGPLPAAADVAELPALPGLRAALELD